MHACMHACIIWPLGHYVLWLLAKPLCVMATGSLPLGQGNYWLNYGASHCCLGYFALLYSADVLVSGMWPLLSNFEY